MTASKQNKCKAIALLHAEALEPGETAYHDCPACGRPDKFAVTRSDLGVLYHCFRATCGASGFVDVQKFGGKRKRRKVKPGRPYTGDLHRISLYDRLRFFVKFGLTREDLERGRFKSTANFGEFAFPVMDPRGYERGIMVRRYNGREPKASSFRDKGDRPWLSWYNHKGEFDRVVLVEDQVSALKLSRYMTTVAILGTSISELEAAEIAAVRPKRVTVALDADATNKAYGIKKAYGLLFSSCDVVILRRDVKDMTPSEIEEKFICR